MTFKPVRFWGHPDDWTDAAWDEFHKLKSSKSFMAKMKCFFWRL